MVKVHLKGKTVCITGGGGGLGKEMAKELLLKGAKVYVLDVIDQDYFDDNLIYQQIDLFTEKPRLETNFDVFISNLGTNLGNINFDDISYEEMLKMLDLNVTIHLWFLKTAKYKKFVFIDSVLSQQGMPGYSLYCASKAFIHILNQSIRREGKDTLIVYPYKINTKLFNEIRNLFVLDANTLAKRIIYDIESGKKEDFVPFYYGYVNLLSSILPTFLTDWIIKMIKRFFVETKKVKND